MKKEIIDCHKETSVWVGSSLWDKNKSGLIGYNKKTNKMVYKKDNSKTWYEAKNQSLIIKKLLDYLDFESGNMNDRKIKEILIKNKLKKKSIKKKVGKIIIN